LALTAKLIKNNIQQGPMMDKLNFTDQWRRRKNHSYYLVDLSVDTCGQKLAGRKCQGDKMWIIQKNSGKCKIGL
jgi:hypothetical protein